MMINLMQGDCLERMKEIPDGSVDMVLTDPPYGINLNTDNRRFSGGNTASVSRRGNGIGPAGGKKIANGKTGAKAANLAHYNTQKSLENQAKCIAAMRKGHVTAPNIAEAANLTPDVARKAIYCLEEANKVTRVGKVTVKGGTATVWKLNVVN
jgi:ribosomal protein S25